MTTVRKGTGTFWPEVREALKTLRRGIDMWRTSPRLMLFGALPALVVGVVFFALFIALIVNLPSLTEMATPFADHWSPMWRNSTRIGLGVAATVLVVMAMVSWFAAITLMVGDPFYERIAEQVERDLGNPPPESDEGWWPEFIRQTKDSLRLGFGGLLLGVLLFVIEMIPGVGSVIALVLGVLLGGRLLVVELTGRALTARGWTLDERRSGLRQMRTRTTVFGAVSYLLFMVPGVSVVAMPVVIASSTILARDVLNSRTPPVASSDPIGS